MRDFGQATLLGRWKEFTLLDSQTEWIIPSTAIDVHSRPKYLHKWHSPGPIAMHTHRAIISQTAIFNSKSKLLFGRSVARTRAPSAREILTANWHSQTFIRPRLYPPPGPIALPAGDPPAWNRMERPHFQHRFTITQPQGCIPWFFFPTFPHSQTSTFPAPKHGPTVRQY